MLQAQTPTLRRGDFVCVKKDHEDHTRAGFDGMVMGVDDGGVQLYFGLDRSGKSQHLVSIGGSHHIYCAGPEAWSLDELDLNTIDTSPIARAN